MNKNAKGMWVITDGEQFFNCRTGKMDAFFIPSKHLFYEWNTVQYKFRFGFPPEFGKLHVEKVELNPVYTPVPDEEIGDLTWK
jgi:hypothetical protein